MAKNTQAEAGGQPSGDAMGFQKGAFAAIVYSHAVNDMSGAFFASLAPLIAKEFGLSLTGSVSSCPSAPSRARCPSRCSAG